MTVIARFKAHGEVAYGIVEKNEVYQMTTTPFEEYEVTDHSHPISDVKLLAPTVPSKVVAIGLNYKSHLGDREAPTVPEPFIKSLSSVIGPGDPIVIPMEATQESVRVEEEAELSLVIGKKMQTSH